MAANIPAERKAKMQEEAKALLLTGIEVTEVARRIGCTTRTVYNWLHSDGFELALTKRQAQVRAELADETVDLVRDAIVCIKDAIKSGDAKAASQVLAASGALAGGAQAAGMSATVETASSGGGITINLTQYTPQEPTTIEAESVSSVTRIANPDA